MKPDSPIITSAFSDDASSGPSYVTAEGAAASDETAAIVSSSVEDVPVFIVGARVSTAYGRGAVTGLRGAPASPDVYCVQLDFGTAYLAAAAVTARALDDLTFEEIIADTETLRARGNAAFAAKDYDAAILNYHLISGTLALAPRSLTLPQRFAMRESIVKALSNACQARINKGDVESAKSAVRSACDALEIDPSNQTGQRDKLLFRRATALMTLKEYTMAVEDLKDQSLATHAGAAAKLREAKDALKREAEKEHNAWRKGFAKAASEEDKKTSEEEGSAATTAPPPLSPPDRKVHFSGSDDGGNTLSTNATPQSSARVATPHPTKNSKLAAKEEEEEEEGKEKDDAYEHDSIFDYAAVGTAVVATVCVAALGLRFLLARK